MDRAIVYPGAIPLDVDVLNVQQRTMTALGALLSATFGTTTLVDGLQCAPTNPASMSVVVSSGSIISVQPLEPQSYGSLPPDVSDSLVKQGINVGATTFALTAPSVSGQSINYLIEGTFQEVDAGPVVVPYYNSSNPSQPYSGPGNSGAPQNTVRRQIASLELKAGAPATAGSQTTPPVDTGYVGLWTITVNYGAVAVYTSNISMYPGAPFIATKMTALAPLLSPGFTGTPTAPKPPDTDSTMRLATTEWVQSVRGFTQSGSFGPGGSLGGLGSTNWTVPAAITRVRVRVWAGGGGSAGAGTNGASAGAHGGGYAEGIYTVSPFQVIQVVAGSGGAAGVGSGNGASGQSSSFGGFCSAVGGAGSTYTASGNGAVSGLPGTASGGTVLNVTGGTASPGISLASSFYSGAGGSSHGTSAAAGAFAQGGYGLFPGGGASGGAAGQSGNIGGHGLVLIDW